MEEFLRNIKNEVCDLKRVMIATLQGEDNMKEKAILWTRQDKRILEDLNSKGRFTIAEKHIEEKQMDISSYYLNMYRWFSDKASSKVERPSGARYPIWCSVSEEYMLRKTEDTVVLKLEVPKENIIYFNGGRWDMALNHMYIPKDEDDDKEFKSELKKRGITNSFSLVEGPNAKFYPDLKRKIVASWDRVFEIENWSDIFTLQANIWEIKSEWILEIEK